MIFVFEEVHFPPDFGSAFRHDIFLSPASSRARPRTISSAIGTRYSEVRTEVIFFSALYFIRLRVFAGVRGNDDVRAQKD